MKNSYKMPILKDFSPYGEELDVKAILKQRQERFRIIDSIFEDKIIDYVIINNNSKNVKLVTNFAPKLQKIDFNRRGVNIFNDAVTQIFDEDKLHDKYFKSKSSNHPIFSLSKGALYQNVLKGHLKQHIKMQDILNQVSEFLFFLMSGHSSIFLVEACFETLKYFVQNVSKMEELKPWVPSVEDIKSVFVDYGASKELLDLNDIPIPLEMISEEQTLEFSPQKCSQKNIFWVFKLMHIILLYCKDSYSIEELDQLLIMFLIVSLNRRFLCTETHNYMLIPKCSRRILGAYPDLDLKEPTKISEIGKMIYSKLKNVNANDIHFVINCCVTCSTLGHRLGQAISYSMINDRVRFLKHVEHFYEVSTNDIKQILNDPRLRDLNYHSQYYILLILDRCITNMIFTTNHQAHLTPINNLLSHFKVNLPEVDESIDYHHLKELVTRMATVWKLSIAEMI